MAKSGARLVEVGTTNRTHPADYAAAITTGTAAIVKVHRSNFAIEGFVAEAASGPRAAGARPPGCLFSRLRQRAADSARRYGLAGRANRGRCRARGRDARRHERRQAARRTPSRHRRRRGRRSSRGCGGNPLARALRVDKLTLAALEATLALYRDPETCRRAIPTLAMLTAPRPQRSRPRRGIATRLRAHGIRPRRSCAAATVGGGAFPTARIPSAALLAAGDPVATEARLRGAAPAIVARIADGMVLLDLRSVPAGAGCRVRRRAGARTRPDQRDASRPARGLSRSRRHDHPRQRISRRPRPGRTGARCRERDRAPSRCRCTRRRHHKSVRARARLFTADIRCVRERTDRRSLAAAGAPLDATYMCPHHPDFTGPCECRKPGIGLYMRAARDLGLDSRASVLIGDRWRRHCRGVRTRGPRYPGSEPGTPAAETQPGDTRGHGRADARSGGHRHSGVVTCSARASSRRHPGSSRDSDALVLLPHLALTIN